MDLSALSDLSELRAFGKEYFCIEYITVWRSVLKMECKFTHIYRYFMAVNAICITLSIIFCRQIAMQQKEAWAKEQQVSEMTIQADTRIQDFLSAYTETRQNLERMQDFLSEYTEIQQKYDAEKMVYDELETDYRKELYLDSIVIKLDHESGSKTWIDRYFRIKKEELHKILDESEVSVKLEAAVLDQEAGDELLPVGDKIWLRYREGSLNDDPPVGLVIQNPTIDIGYKDARAGMYLFDIEAEGTDAKVGWTDTQWGHFRYLCFEDDSYTYYFVAIADYGDCTILYIEPNS